MISAAFPEDTHTPSAQTSATTVATAQSLTAVQSAQRRRTISIEHLIARDIDAYTKARTAA